MVNDLNTIDLGNVGDTIDAIILYAIDNGHTYAMCPIDYDLITHVCDIMPKQVIFIMTRAHICIHLYVYQIPCSHF